jgi:hypothetical protein
MHMPIDRSLDHAPGLHSTLKIKADRITRPIFAPDCRFPRTKKHSTAPPPPSSSSCPSCYASPARSFEEGEAPPSARRKRWWGGVENERVREETARRGGSTGATAPPGARGGAVSLAAVSLAEVRGRSERCETLPPCRFDISRRSSGGMAVAVLQNLGDC